MRRSLAALFFSGVLTMGVRAAAVPLSVDGGQRFQTIDGFGVSANSASWDGGELRPAIDRLLSGGSSIFRVIIENTDWEATNDNTDPQVMNTAYYDQVYSSPKFEELWSTIGYLNSKGVSDRLMLNFMGRLPPWMGGADLGTAMIDEWVETTVSAAQYGRLRRGLRFGLFAPSNEIDWDGIEGPRMSAANYAVALRKLSQRLDQLGIKDLRLVGPDTAIVFRGVGDYLPALFAEPSIMQKLAAFALHDYSGNTGGARAAIDASRYPATPFWMTELSLFDHALTSVGQGGASAVLIWDGFDSVYQHAILAGRGTTPPNDAGNGPALLAYDVATRTYSPRKVYHEVSQLFQFVAPGSQVIGTVENDANLTVVAFHHLATGAVTLVGKNPSAASITIEGTLRGLPALARFAHYRTNATLNRERQADVPVANARFSFAVPAQTIFTLYGAGPPASVPALGKRPTAHLALLGILFGLVVLGRRRRSSDDSQRTPSLDRRHSASTMPRS